MSTVQFRFPQPPAGRIWCTVCANEFMKKVNLSIREDLEKANADEGNTVVFFDMKNLPGDMPILNHAVVRGMSGILPIGQFLDLCWTHFTPLDVRGPGQVAPVQGDVSQLLQQQGGKMLGRR
jgi:hypothetical protein